MAFCEFISPTVRQFIVVFLVNLGILNFGLAIGWASSVLVKLADLEQSPLSHTVTGTQAFWIANVISVSGIVAHAISAKLVDSIGRKYCFVVAGVLRTLSNLCLLFATELWMLILGRFIGGFADGIIFGVSAMYSAEIANKELRGSLGTLLQAFTAFGILIGMAVGPFVSYKEMNLLYVILALVALIPTAFIPDSPYYLYKNGDKVNARKWLVYFRGSEALASEEMKEYDLVTDEPVKISEIFKSKVTLKGIGLGMLLGGGVQFTGFINLQYFLQTILISTGSQLSPEIASLFLGVVQLLASSTATFISDRFSRKRILLTGLIGNTFGLFGLAMFFQLTVNAGYEVAGFLNVLPIISYIVCTIFNGCGIMSVIWTMLAELYDGRFRGVGVALGAITSQICIIITGLVFPIVSEALGPAVPFWIFIGLTTSITIIFALVIPETKDKTFAEIQMMLAGDKPNIEHGIENQASCTK